MPPLNPELDAAVERHWAAATHRAALFNGRVFSADRLRPDVIEGHWTEYRRVVAQMADPGLCAALRVRNLAVCGVVCGPGGVLVGRRHAAAAYQAGMWQLPPAGSVDDGAAEPGGASWEAAVTAELHEELGLHPHDVSALRPLCVVQHPTGVLDLGIRIDTALDASTLLRRSAGARDREYDRILALPPDRLRPTLEAAGGILVPSAPIFLEHAFPGS